MTGKTLKIEKSKQVSVDHTRHCTCIHQLKIHRLHATFKVIRACIYSSCGRYWKFHNEYHHQHVTLHHVHSNPLAATTVPDTWCDPLPLDVSRSVSRSVSWSVSWSVDWCILLVSLVWWQASRSRWMMHADSTRYCGGSSCEDSFLTRVPSNKATHVSLMVILKLIPFIRSAVEKVDVACCCCCCLKISNIGKKRQFCSYSCLYLHIK